MHPRGGGGGGGRGREALTKPYALLVNQEAT